MALQTKNVIVNSNATTIPSIKADKGSAKPRGSSSPFKCIGLGIAQQITEKEEELAIARCKIEELETLVASKQKQIFSLNIRLASAESMTHDVLRDLLSIKLDMTKYAMMNERSQSDDVKEKKDYDWGKLKKQVDEFVEERQRLIEEINKRHKELMATQITYEKLQEHQKLLATENESLKTDNAAYKSIVIELEEKLDKTMQRSESSIGLLHA